MTLFIDLTDIRPRPSLVPKGKLQPVVVYSVLPRVPQKGTGPEALRQMGLMGHGGPDWIEAENRERTGPVKPLVGCELEIELIMGRVSSMISGSRGQNGAGGAIVIEGNTGL